MIDPDLFVFIIMVAVILTICDDIFIDNGAAIGIIDKNISPLVLQQIFIAIYGGVEGLVDSIEINTLAKSCCSISAVIGGQNIAILGRDKAVFGIGAGIDREPPGQLCLVPFQRIDG